MLLGKAQLLLHAFFDISRPPKVVKWRTVPACYSNPKVVKRRTRTHPARSRCIQRCVHQSCCFYVTLYAPELPHKTLILLRSPTAPFPTRYSGITPQLLEGVDTRLHQVQAAMLRIVGANDLLVGHSLENDLKALKMVHLRCLDTSLLYPHPKKSRRSSLRYLVSM